MPVVSVSFHDKTSRKILTLKSKNTVLTEDVVLYFNNIGGTLITYEELQNPDSLPAEFIAACKGDEGRGISSIDFDSTTDVSGKAGIPGATDTYRIKYSDGNFSFYSLYNGLRVSDTMTVAQINAAIASAIDIVVGGAPTLMDTLKELADMFGDDPNAFNALVATVGKKADLTTVQAIRDTLQTNIDKKADTSAVNALVNNLNNADIALQNNINALSNSTAASVAKLSMLPQLYKIADYQLASGDQACSVDSAANIYIPTDAAVALPVGTVIGFTNMSGGTTYVVPQAGVTLILSGTTSTGNRTLKTWATGTFHKVGANVWIISGSGVL